VRKLLNLVLNENMKIYSRIRTWIMVGLLLLGTSLTQFLTQYSWSKYILFANTDLTQHIEGRPFFEDMTMTFSVTVLIVYFVMINALSWGIFKKRDVAA
jgi:ABC-2 type transport system permease protein